MKPKEEGITLVAIVVTIIVLLILAGVTISLTILGDGIFGRARNATSKYINEVNNENKTLSDYENQFINYTNEYTETSISETSSPRKVSEHLGSYLGKTVNYAPKSNFYSSLTNWKVFYADTNNIFLIYGNYLEYPYISENVGLSPVDADGTKPYTVKWSTIPDAQSITSLSSSFMFTGYTDYETNDNGKCVSTLLNTNNWTDFVNDDYADFAIGSPTIEMFEASWNANDGYTKIYSKVVNTNNYGYNVGTSNPPGASDFFASLANATSLQNTLYYPHNTSAYRGCSGYYLSSPSALANNIMLAINHNLGQVNIANVSTSTYYCLRPVVRIKNNVNLTTENKGECDFGLSI